MMRRVMMGQRLTRAVLAPLPGGVAAALRSWPRSMARGAMLVLLLGSVATASAQPTGRTPPPLTGVGLDERLGHFVPMDLAFLDEHGEEVQLGDYFDGERPVLLTLAYHDCPMLCSMVLRGLAKALGPMTWVPGGRFDVVTVSFNPGETPLIAAEEKETVLRMLGKPEASEGWHFLTGGQASIDALTDAVGFRFRWIEEEQIYAHPSTLIFLSGSGQVSRYLYGIEYDPRAVRTALVEASAGRVGSTLDQVMLYCLRFDPGANAYVLHAVNAMKLGGGLTVLLLGLFLFICWRRDSRRPWRSARLAVGGLSAGMSRGSDPDRRT